MALADMSAAIGISSIVSRYINECLPEDLECFGGTSDRLQGLKISIYRTLQKAYC